MKIRVYIITSIDTEKKTSDLSADWLVYRYVITSIAVGASFLHGTANIKHDTGAPAGESCCKSSNGHIFTFTQGMPLRTIVVSRGQAGDSF